MCKSFYDCNEVYANCANKNCLRKWLFINRIPLRAGTPLATVTKCTWRFSNLCVCGERKGGIRRDSWISKDVTSVMKRVCTPNMCHSGSQQIFCCYLSHRHGKSFGSLACPWHAPMPGLLYGPYMTRNWSQWNPRITSPWDGGPSDPRDVPWD